MSDPAALIVEFAVWYSVFLFSLTLHEGAHALVAYLGGDRTAYLGGQVSINPVPHIRREPFGTVLVPILLFVSSGWMMGWASTPYDPHWARRHPRRQALMALAGPAANLLIAAVALLALRLLLAAGVFAIPWGEQLGFTRLVVPPEGTAGDSLLVPLGMLLSVAVNLNVLLGLFNLIPIPPLDGAGALEGAGPPAVARLYERMRMTPFMGIVGLLAAWQIIGQIAGPALGLVVRLLYG